MSTNGKSPNFDLGTFSSEFAFNKSHEHFRVRPGADGKSVFAFWIYEDEKIRAKQAGYKSDELTVHQDAIRIALENGSYTSERLVITRSPSGLDFIFFVGDKKEVFRRGMELAYSVWALRALEATHAMRDVGDMLMSGGGERFRTGLRELFTSFEAPEKVPQAPRSRERMSSHDAADRLTSALITSGHKPAEERERPGQDKKRLVLRAVAEQLGVETYEEMEIILLRAHVQVAKDGTVPVSVIPRIQAAMAAPGAAPTVAADEADTSENKVVLAAVVPAAPTVRPDTTFDELVKVSGKSSFIVKLALKQIGFTVPKAGRGPIPADKAEEVLDLIADKTKSNGAAAQQ